MKRLKSLEFVLFISSLGGKLCFFSLLYHDQINRWLPLRFDEIAVRLLKGEEHIHPTAWASFHIPLALFYRFLELLGFFEQRLYFLGLLNCLLGAFAVVVFFRICSRIFGENKYFPLVLSLCFLFYYPLNYIHLLALSENFFCPLFLLAFYLLLDGVKISPLRSCLVGALLASCLVIRPIVAPFIVLAFVWMFWSFCWNTRVFAKRFVLPFLPVFAYVIVVVSLINREMHEFKKASFAGNGGVNFTLTWCQPRKVRFTLPDGRSRWFSSPAYWSGNPQSDISGGVPFFEQGHYYRLGLACLLEHPERLLSNLKNVKNIFYSRFYPNVLEETWHYYALDFWRIFGLFSLLGFISAPLLLKDKRREWSLSATLIFTLLLSVFLANPGEERYLAPYYFVLLLWGFPAWGKVLAQVFPLRGELRTLILGVVVAACLSALLASGVESEKATFEQSGENSREINVRVINLAYKNALQWLVNNQNTDGSFVYKKHSKSFKISEKDNLARQLLTSHGLALASKRFPVRVVVDAHAKNLEFLRGVIRRGEGFSFVQEGEVLPDLNSTAFAALTLLDSPFRSEFQKEIQELGNFVLHMQKSDGSFRALFIENFNDKEWRKLEERRLRFASGEAALVCAEMYRVTKQIPYRKCFEQAFAYYYPRILEGFHPGTGAWHAIAYSKAYQATGEARYLNAAQVLVDKVIALQNQSGTAVGGFDKEGTWWTSAEAVFTDAIIRVIAVAPSSPKNFEYKEAVELALGNLLKLQFGAAEDYRIAGGISNEHGSDYIYVDNIGHSLVAFEDYLRLQDFHRNKRKKKSPAPDQSS